MTEELIKSLVKISLEAPYGKSEYKKEISEGVKRIIFCERNDSGSFFVNDLKYVNNSGEELYRNRHGNYVEKSELETRDFLNNFFLEMKDTFWRMFNPDYGFGKLI